MAVETSLEISAANLAVHKGGRRILSGVTCRFAPATLTAVIGPNGAGKSTLLRLIAGLETPSTGRVHLGGQDAHAMPAGERARQLAWVPDHADVPFAFTAEETVLMGRFPWHQGAPKRRDREAAAAALATLGVSALAARPLASLSSGERQKVQVARALAGETPCLLLDEPTANLDIGAALHLLGLLRELAARGRTVLVTLHDLTLAYRFAGAGLCLAGGSVVAAGEPAAVFAPAVLAAAFGVQTAIARTSQGEEVLHFEVPSADRGA